MDINSSEMNIKKLTTFILWAFLPMIGIGVAMNFFPVPATDLNAEGGADSVTVNTLIRAALSSAAMLLPLLAVVMTQLMFREPIFRGIGISFKVNRWWLIGWILMPLVSLATVGMTLLMPGAEWNTDTPIMQATLQSMPEGMGVWGMIAITLVSGLFAGATINCVLAFGEEIGWRGYLLEVFKGKKFMTAALWTGIIWGIWHAPIILNGHNYPQHPVAGAFMMVIFCTLMTPMMMYFRKKSGSVIVPAIMHGTFNAVAGINMLVIPQQNDLLYGCAGAAGMMVLLLTDGCLYVYDRYISKENVFGSSL
jgi:membrane protease YdiL (CAAX protease family)